MFAEGTAAGLYYLEQPAAGDRQPVALVVAFHGRGSSAGDLAGLAAYLPPEWHYLFPQAPLPLSFGSFGIGYSWYEPIPARPQQMLAARETVAAFLAEARARLAIPPDRIALMGFSQGAVMTLDVGLRATEPYAALVAMSGYLAPADDLPAAIAAKQRQPVLIVHGTRDTVLEVTLARRARQTLETHGLTPEYQEFPMAHEVSADSLAVVRAFLERHLKTSAVA